MFKTLMFLLQFPIIVGVFLNTYYDIRLNIIGLVYAAFGVLITSTYQVVRQLICHDSSPVYLSIVHQIHKVLYHQHTDTHTHIYTNITEELYI